MDKLMRDQLDEVFEQVTNKFLERVPVPEFAHEIWPKLYWEDDKWSVIFEIKSDDDLSELTKHLGSDMFEHMMDDFFDLFVSVAKFDLGSGVEDLLINSFDQHRVFVNDARVY